MEVELYFDSVIEQVMVEVKLQHGLEKIFDDLGDEFLIVSAKIR